MLDALRICSVGHFAVYMEGKCLMNNQEYMRRAIELARKGAGWTSPNPMVGAVIVHNDRIIGEGFHARYGGPHAEVNAINSVSDSDRHLLKDSTMYVTLEPCAHYGKTPPCADLIVKTGIPGVVVSILDPNPLVAGKGVKILRDSGVEVVTGILEDESKELNRRFLKAHSSPEPWVILKWAQSADGFMAIVDGNGKPKPVRFSSPISTVWMHRERAKVDAIMVGSKTELIDSPRLNVRDWGGNSPKKVIADSSFDCKTFVENLRAEGVTSLMVEGGATLLKSFISENVFDEIRVEISSVKLRHGLPAPALPEGIYLHHHEICQGNMILYFRR